MARIRINTGTVLGVTKNIAAYAVLAKAIGAVIRATGLMAHTYDNNTFGPQVRAICTDAGARAVKSGGALANLSVVLGLKTLAFMKADSSFFSKIWSWIKPPVTLPVLNVGVSTSGDYLDGAQTRVPESIKEKVTMLSVNAPKNNCALYVKNIRQGLGLSTPGGFVRKGELDEKGNVMYSNGAYQGDFRGKTGNQPFKYGQNPEIGSIVVESTNATNGITYGHVSIVDSIDYNSKGKPNSFTVSEANWGSTTTTHSETFTWNESKQSYLSSDGKRSPDCFVY